MLLTTCNICFQLSIRWQSFPEDARGVRIRGTVTALRCMRVYLPPHV